MAKTASAGAGELTVVRLAPSRMDDMQEVLRGSWGSACFCMFPRLTANTRRETPVPAGPGSRSRRMMTALARRRRAPGLLAYVGGDVAGWIAVAPRPELARIDSSRATPRVDDVDVWVIPCITVRRRFRGRGVAQDLIRAAVEYATAQGAPAVEAYPRTDRKRLHDDFAFIGTEALFRKAGYRRIRGVMPKLPKGWAPRVTMRATCGSSPKTSSASRRRSKPAR